MRPLPRFGRQATQATVAGGASAGATPIVGSEFALDCNPPRSNYDAETGLGPAGEMSEWLKEHAWKACVGVTLPRVRIPLSPLFSVQALRQTPNGVFRCERCIYARELMIRWVVSCGQNSGRFCATVVWVWTRVLGGSDPSREYALVYKVKTTSNRLR